MKKITLLLIFMILVGCGGQVKNVHIQPYESNIYSDNDMQEAIAEIKTYFQKEFDDCILKELKDVGDDSLNQWQEYATRNQKDEVIVFTSTFDVGNKGGNGSLQPNDTYYNWKWILARNKEGNWEHIDHGY